MTRFSVLKHGVRLAALAFAAVLLPPLPAARAEGPASLSDALDLSAPAPKSGWDFSDARLIPIQAGGRIKPLDSFAGEVVLYLTGSRTLSGWENMDLVLSLLSRPEAWAKQPLVKVDNPEVRRQLLLDETRNKFAPDELFHSPVLLQYAQSLDGGASKLMDPRGAVGQTSPRERDLRKLLNRLGLYRSVLSGEAWTIVPLGDAKNWAHLADEKRIAGSPVRDAFAEMVRAYSRGDREAFGRLAAAARSVVESGVPGWDEQHRTNLKLESFYNRSRPFRAACFLYLVACMAWGVALSLGGKTEGKKRHPAALVAMGLTLVALAVHTMGFGLRMWISGRPPVSNMYESVIWVSFGAVVFSLVIYFVQKQRQAILLATATAVAGFGLLAADSAPAVMDPTIQPLVPVLRSNFWLTIHVLTITLGYAAFALAMGLGNVTLSYFLRFKGTKASPGLTQRIASVNQLMYRALQIGVVLLAAGTILGGVWADYSWGRFWGWDPKETWALIALLTYLAVLHARYTGWVGQFGFAAWSVANFMAVVMAWYGVNYVLGVGLHSYGFSSGGVGTVAAFVMVQLIFVIAVTVLHAKRTGALK